MRIFFVMLSLLAVMLLDTGGPVSATTDVLPTTANTLAKFSDSAASLGNSGIVEVNGNVGIGTTIPEAKLDVYTDSAAGSGASTVLRLIGTAQNNGDGNAIEFLSGTRVQQAAKIYTLLRDNDKADLVFARGDGASGYTESMTIDQNGNVGIGTVSPSTKLHVVGDLTVTGNLSAKYQDVAEWVETPTPLEPGTVVIVDPLMPNRVLRASRAYDTRVAGAVSQQPGLILGERGDKKEMVAQSGRVRIKVDAQYGAIRIGDLLVTSSTPGYAMRSRPMRVGSQAIHRSGTLLGKALEALPSGKGEILVLLTLQ